MNILEERVLHLLFVFTTAVWMLISYDPFWDLVGLNSQSEFCWSLVLRTELQKAPLRIFKNFLSVVPMRQTLGKHIFRNFQKYFSLCIFCCWFPFFRPGKMHLLFFFLTYKINRQVVTFSYYLEISFAGSYIKVSSVVSLLL